MTLIEAKTPLLKILEERRTGTIKDDDDMESKIFELFDRNGAYPALFNGDDPKSWYKSLSVWKKAKFDTVHKKWMLLKNS